MEDDLRIIITTVDDLIEYLKKQTWKLDQAFFAFAEEWEDNPKSEELYAMANIADGYAKQSESYLATIRDYMTDLRKELA